MLTADELALMQSCQVAYMHDTCQILTYTVGSDDYGLNNPTYIAGTAVECGLELISGRQREQLGAAFVPVIDAHLRLSLTMVGLIDPKDRIRVTHRYSVALTTPQTFEIVGQPKRGPSGLVLDLKIVTDGTEVGA